MSVNLEMPAITIAHYQGQHIIIHIQYVLRITYWTGTQLKINSLINKL